MSLDPLPSDEAVREAFWIIPASGIDMDDVRATLTAAYAIDMPRVRAGANKLRAENQRLRELYENAVGNRERFGWTINHLLECEEALRVAQEEAAEVRAATLREVAMRECTGARDCPAIEHLPGCFLAPFNPEAEPKRPRNHAPWCCVEHEGPCDFNQEAG